jgi:hypothetical protein
LKQKTKCDVTCVPCKIHESDKNYYETVIKKSKSENFLFFKNESNSIKIYCDLGIEAAAPNLFTEIDKIKGNHVVDFDIMEMSNN